jgi:hypothetical protein
MGPMGRRMWGLIAGLGLGLGLGLALVSCSDETPEAESDDEAATDEDGAITEPELREELLEMMDADQAERTGEVGANGDAERTDRLREIVDEHGWPIFRLVGRDGATAAWVIAQHSDQEVGFQEEALGLMQAAAEDDQVDPSELAYLEDRVAVNNGEPQRYGTQVRCGPDGAEPATPLADAEGVDDLRAEVHLDPLADYLAEFAEGCAEEAPSAP